MAMGKIGGKTVFAGQLGTDSLGAELIKGLLKFMAEMKQENICMDYINIVAEVESGQAIIILDKHGNNSIIIMGGANMHYSKPFALPKKFEEAIDKCKFQS